MDEWSSLSVMSSFLEPVSSLQVGNFKRDVTSDEVPGMVFTEKVKPVKMQKPKLSIDTKAGSILLKTELLINNTSSKPS